MWINFETILSFTSVDYIKDMKIALGVWRHMSLNQNMVQEQNMYCNKIQEYEIDYVNSKHKSQLHVLYSN